MNKHGLTKQFTWANTKMVRNMVKENSCGQMTVHTKEISLRIIFMVMGNMSGKMGGFIKEVGRITKCRGRGP